MESREVSLADALALFAMKHPDDWAALRPHVDLCGTADPDELVCDACGQRECFEGTLMCWVSKAAGTCTRREFAP